jgi:hypothetical protein
MSTADGVCFNSDACAPVDTYEEYVFKAEALRVLDDYHLQQAQQPLFLCHRAASPVQQNGWF